VTRSRFLAGVGFPWRRSHDLPLTDIEGVDVYQPSLGKLLNFGKLKLRTKDGKRLSFRLVKDPFQLGKVILESRQT